MGARQATAVPIPATLNVVSGGATDHDLLAGRATREASGLRAELPGEGSVPTKRAALVNGWGKVALHGRAAVAEIVGILVVRLPAKRKHVVLPHRHVGGRTLAVRLKDLRRAVLKADTGSDPAPVAANMLWPPFAPPYMNCCWA